MPPHIPVPYPKRATPARRGVRPSSGIASPRASGMIALCIVCIGTARGVQSIAETRCIEKCASCKTRVVVVSCPFKHTAIIAAARVYLRMTFSRSVVLAHHSDRHHKMPLLLHMVVQCSPLVDCSVVFVLVSQGRPIVSISTSDTQTR